MSCPMGQISNYRTGKRIKTTAKTVTKHEQLHLDAYPPSRAHLSPLKDDVGLDPAKDVMEAAFRHARKCIEARVVSIKELIDQFHITVSMLMHAPSLRMKITIIFMNDFKQE